MNQKTSIFHHCKNYGSLTRVSRLKIALNMADHTCLLGDSSNPEKCPLIWQNPKQGETCFDIIPFCDELVESVK